MVVVVVVREAALVQMVMMQENQSVKSSSRVQVVECHDVCQIKLISGKHSATVRYPYSTQVQNLVIN